LEEYERIGLRLIVFRLVIALTFLASSIGLQVALGEQLLLRPYFYFTALVLLLEIIYLLIYALFQRIRKSESFIYIQLLGDSCTVMVLLFFTGGQSSVFVFLCHFLIVVAGSILRKRGAFLVALVNSLLFGMLCLNLYYGWLRPNTAFRGPYEAPTPSEAFNALATNLIGFFLVATLISAMATRMEKSRTELGAARKDLSYYRHLNDLIVSSLSGGIVVTDLSGKVNMSTAKGRELLAMTVTEGWKLNERIESLGGPPLNFSGGNINNCDIPLSLPNDNHVMVSISPLSEGDNSVGYLALVRDETDIVRIRNELGLKERLVALGEMAANMAHEIKNPLGSISGAAQMLKAEASEGSSQSELLVIIHKECIRLAEVLDNFLKFANPPKPEKSLCNLYRLCLDTATLFEKHPFFTEKKLSLKYDHMEKDVSAVVDRNQFTQAFWNLLQNGRKASNEGGKMTISLRKSSSWAIVEVSDNGVGMPKSELDKIQEPFKRGFSVGAGLGLSVVYRIMEQHDGKLEIESNYGTGTAARLYFPLE
jgi:two-component system, NtrC family, sensor histidine kinase PilS